jgi:hypothetical protein
MPRRTSPASPPAPRAVALLQTRTPPAAGLDVGATARWGCVPPRPPWRSLHRRPARHRRLGAAVPGDDGGQGVARRGLAPAL